MGSTHIEIITVVRNDPEGLIRTIESVHEQSYESVRHIIIDGASNDEKTSDILNLYKDKVGLIVSEPDKGIYDAMNKGMSYAKEDSFIIFLNAGDVFADNDGLLIIAKEAEGDTEAVYGNILVKDADNKLVSQKARKFDFAHLLSFGTGVLCHQAFFIKKSLAPKYNLDYKLKAELDWYFEILEQHPNLKINHVDHSVVIFAVGGAGYQNFIKSRLEWLRVVRRRYGLRAISDSGLFLYLMKNSSYRYPWIERVPLNLQLFKGIALIFKAITRPLEPVKIRKR